MWKGSKIKLLLTPLPLKCKICNFRATEYRWQTRNQAVWYQTTLLSKLMYYVQTHRGTVLHVSKKTGSRVQAFASQLTNNRLEGRQCLQNGKDSFNTRTHVIFTRDSCSMAPRFEGCRFCKIIHLHVCGYRRCRACVPLPTGLV